MKIAILGGGITGLTAAYYLSNKGFEVSLFEKNKNFGGLAAGFKKNNWQWYLDNTYHHLFSNDQEVTNFAKETGFHKIFFKKPITASLYEIKINKKKQYKSYQLDSALSLLKFPLLSLHQKLRAGFGLALLKTSPFLSIYEKETAFKFLYKTMGKPATDILFSQLFRKKFGKYAENILASFIWARIKKRTKKLGYIEGGFQALIDYLVKVLKKKQVKLYPNMPIFMIEKTEKAYLVNNQLFDLVISTLPTPVLGGLARSIFPADFLNNLRKIKYLNALTLIFELKKPFLNKTYWLNVIAESVPIMGIVEHTNFIDKRYYNNHHLVYLGWYLDKKDSRLTMTTNQLARWVFPYLKDINPNFSLDQIVDCFSFRASFAQPVFDQDFLNNKPGFTTPLKNFYIANLDMTYPYDRGINYAVSLGKRIAELIIAEKLR